MRLLVVVAVIALAGCQSDGKPSPAAGNALKSFMEGFQGGRVVSPAPVAQPAPPIIPQSVQAIGYTASFTGQARHVQTVTGSMAWECVYSYGAEKFVLMFEGYCPSTALIR